MILATFSLLLLLALVLVVVVVLLLLLLLKEEYQKHLPVWQSYQIHTVHRKSPNTGALRPSISNGKWDNVLSQEKSKHRGIAAVNFEWQMGQCLIPWRAPPCVCRGRRILFPMAEFPRGVVKSSLILMLKDSIYLKVINVTSFSIWICFKMRCPFLVPK